MDKMYLTLIVGMMSCLVLMESVNAFTHIVGGSNGWRVPENKTFFEEWTKPRSFGVGDRLVFPYRPGANNLVVVKKADYDVCGQDDVITMYFLGPTILNLTAPGDYYYYDGIGKHCEAGQKLHIQVGSKEGTSGSDPLPFNLEQVGVDRTSFGSLLSAPAPAPTATNVSSTAVIFTDKLGFVSAGMLFSSMVLSMFV